MVGRSERQPYRTTLIEILKGEREREKERERERERERSDEEAW